MRAGRLLELVLLLQSGRRLTAGQLAERLEVSPRTVLRDIETLSGAGVPVRSVRGPDGGFELLDGYDSGLDRGAPLPPHDGTPLRRARGAVRISPEGRRRAAVLGRLQPLRLRRGVEPDADGWVEATFRLGSLEATVADVLSLGAEIEVLTPTRLRDRVAAEVAALGARYRVTDSPDGG
ncbi:MAG: HTH domain-containing protein [Actinomycetota bacterium]